LRVQLAHRGERAVVEVFAVDERAHDRGERAVPALGPERARLDPRVALPLASLGDEIILQHAEAHGERPVGAQRAQAHIDAEHIAVGGHFIEHRNQAPRNPDKEFVVA
jgi:hypothetical protein